MTKAQERKHLKAAGFRLCRDTFTYVTSYRLAESQLFGIAIGVRYAGPKLRRKVYHEAADRLVAACQRYAHTLKPADLAKKEAR
jgi:hypothetical protein